MNLIFSTINNPTSIGSSFKISIRAWHLFTMNSKLLDADSKVWTINNAHALGIRRISLFHNLNNFPLSITRLSPKFTKFLQHPFTHYLDQLNTLSILDVTSMKRLEMNKIIDFRRTIINTLTSHIGCVVFEWMLGNIGIELEPNGLVDFFDHSIQPRPTSLFQH